MDPEDRDQEDITTGAEHYSTDAGSKRKFIFSFLACVSPGM